MLYLVRHAHAIDSEDDAARTLSDRGHLELVALARFLRGTGAFVPADVWHSPFIRAKETAELLVQLLHLDARLLELPDLRPDDDPKATVRRLKIVKRPLAIVGHEPHLSSLASLLVGGALSPPLFNVKKSSVLALEGAGTRWLVRWMISPELLG